MIWALESFETTWRVMDTAVTRQDARALLAWRKEIFPGRKFRIRKYVRAEK